MTCSDMLYSSCFYVACFFIWVPSYLLRMFCSSILNYLFRHAVVVAIYTWNPHLTLLWLAAYYTVSLCWISQLFHNKSLVTLINVVFSGFIVRPVQLSVALMMAGNKGLQVFKITMLVLRNHTFKFLMSQKLHMIIFRNNNRLLHKLLIHNFLQLIRWPRVINQLCKMLHL
jgi:hypothetical protein